MSNHPATIQPGDAFHFDPDGRNQPHLWVVLHVYRLELDDTEWALIVHITTVNQGTREDQKACLMRVSDVDRYPFVHHDSCAHYGGILEVEIANLRKHPARQAVSPSLLARLRDGLHRSLHTKKRFKKLCSQC